MRSADPLARVHYVYIHRRATDGSIFYVGKGKGRRAWGWSGRNSWWHNVANKHGFSVDVVTKNLPEWCALTVERICIAKIGKPNLVNLTDGGGGISGWSHSDEAKARIGAFHRGKPKKPDAIRKTREANIGKKISDMSKAKMSAAKKGVPRGPVSADTRAKISKSHFGIRPSAETLVKMSLSKIGKNKGKDSASYDHAVRRFSHKDGREFLGTRAEFIAEYGLPNGCVSAAITGRQKSVKGWKLS